jgi:aspartate/methionine/tyrosine aminotransferase
MIAHYDGSARVRDVYPAIARYYDRALGGRGLTDAHVVPFDGCHDALGHAIGAFTATPGWGRGKETVLYPVPGYPYWAIAAAARREAAPVDALDPETFLARLEAFPHPRAGAVVVHHPGNPLGYTFARHQLRRLGELAERRGWGIVVDATYHAFAGGDAPLAALDELPADRTIVCDSVSKAWAAPGLRLGFAICFDERLAAALRAGKSGASLLPSSLKQRFFGHLLTEHADLPARIAGAVHERKRRARAAWASGAAASLGATFDPSETCGPFGVVWVPELCRREGVTPETLAHELRERAGIVTLPSAKFYPPRGAHAARAPFLRLSFGTMREVENGIAALTAALAELAPHEQRVPAAAAREG